MRKSVTAKKKIGRACRKDERRGENKRNKNVEAASARGGGGRFKKKKNHTSQHALLSCTPPWPTAMEITSRGILNLVVVVLTAYEGAADERGGRGGGGRGGV